jgi:hypothetical protein
VTFWLPRRFLKKGLPSYVGNPLILWWAIQDSNLWPLAPEANALST